MLTFLYSSTDLITHSHVLGQCFKHQPDSVLVADDDATHEAEFDFCDDEEAFSYIQYSGNFL